MVQGGGVLPVRSVIVGEKGPESVMPFMGSLSLSGTPTYTVHNASNATYTNATAVR